MNTHTSQRSQTGMLAVLIALLLPMLMGFLALSIDVGYMLLTRNRMQIAADSAAIAAADALMHNQGIDAATAMAQTAAVANGFTDQVSMTSVAVLIPPTGTAPFSQDSNYVRVTVSQTVPTFLASFFGIASSLRSAYAIAGPASSGNPCLLSLSSSGSGVVSASGNVTMTANGCGIFSNSTSPSSIMLNGNVTLNASTISTVGGVSKSGNVTTSPVTTGAAKTADPFLNVTYPSFSGCSFTNYSASGNGLVTLTPGTYCGGINISGNHVVNLTPGLYTLYGGGFNVSGNVSPISGTGVSFYNTGSGTTGPNAYAALDLSGNSMLDLSAPLTGANAGMLFMQDPLNIYGAAISGNSGSRLLGNLYFPNSTVSMSGNSATSIPIGSVVAQKITMSGNVNFSVSNIYGSSGSSAMHAGLYQ